MSLTSSIERPISGQKRPNKSEDYDFDFEEIFRHYCVDCHKYFASKWTLRGHLSKFHPDKALKSKKNLSLPCKVSSTKFDNKYNPNAPQKANHDKRKTIKKLHQCFMCSAELAKLDLLNHYANEHHIDIIEESLNFSTYKEVIKWKEDMEKESNVKFIIYRGAKKNAETKHHYFKCYRSGYYNSRSAGIRRPRTQGSIKTKYLCPSTINVTEYADGKCRVKYVKTHIGHDKELKHLKLPAAKITKTITKKLSKQIPLDEILDNIKDSVSEFGNLQRSHLLTKQDLSDIENVFQFDCSKYSDDATSINMWVQDGEESIRESFILLYKPQGVVVEQMPCLKSDDLVLVVMNEAQKEMLKKYGSDCVCVDRTLGLNDDGFQLITLMIVDDKREGFPCAFLICNRPEEQVLEVFFRCIKEETGTVTPAIFMSDMANSFYNAWCYAMGNPKQHLYCTWCVDEAWRKDLSKITETEKQVMVYKLLRTLLEERDENAVASMMESSLTQLSAHIDTTAFAEYFKEHYLKTIKQWAICYRLSCGLNAIVHLQRMHKTLEYIYFKGKSVKRLDKTIDALMHFLGKKFLESVITLNKGKVSVILKKIIKAHKESYNFSTTISKTKEGWRFLSSKGKKTYLVQRNVKECSRSCKIICKDCDACIHKYLCNCFENSIKWNMCKHIHRVCMSMKNEDSSYAMMDACGDLNITYENTNEQYYLQPLQNASNLDQFGNEKSRLKTEFIEMIDLCTTKWQLEYMRKTLSQLKTSLPTTLHSTVHI